MLSSIKMEVKGIPPATWTAAVGNGVGFGQPPLEPPVLRKKMKNESKVVKKVKKKG